jgi:hypothetical protein
VAMMQPTLTSSPPPALWPAIPRIPPIVPRSLALWRALHAHGTLGTLSIGSILTRWSAWTMRSLLAIAEPEHLPSSYHFRQMGTWLGAGSAGKDARREAGSLRRAGDARMDSVVVSLSKFLPGEAADDEHWFSSLWPAGTMIASASLAL